MDSKSSDLARHVAGFLWATLKIAAWCWFVFVTCMVAVLLGIISGVFRQVRRPT